MATFGVLRTRPGGSVSDSIHATARSMAVLASTSRTRELRAITVGRHERRATGMCVGDEVLVLGVIETGLVRGPRFVARAPQPPSHLGRHALVDDEAHAATPWPFPSARR